MSLRTRLSQALRDAKDNSGYTYDQLAEKSGLGKTIIRYALNGGEGAGLDTFETLFKICNTTVNIDVYFEE